MKLADTKTFAVGRCACHAGPNRQPKRVVTHNHLHRCSLGWLLLFPVLVAGACGAVAAAMPTAAAGGEVLLGAFGVRHPQVASFKGIPFAAPPVGELRWREPQPHKPRAGTQRALEFAPACFQDSYNTDWYRSVGAAFGAAPATFTNPRFSEDCLYLNVWTPRTTPGERLPVIVWIHGGANRSGWSFEPNYLGESLAARGNVVVVSIAYRVGIFGFFGHPQLRGTRAPANFGLLDQIAALRWVHDHVAAFGGDPDNVTVAGESAGASNIGYLTISPLAQGWFRRAISQSGGFQMLDRGDLATAERTGLALSGAIDSQPDLDGLRRFACPHIWDASIRGLPGHDFAPVVDGISVQRSPAVAYSRDGVQHDLLIGSNEDEWYMYLDADTHGLATDLDGFASSAREALEARAARESDVRTARDKVFTLVNMVCPSYLMAGAARGAGRSAWVYRFTRVRPGPGGAALGAYHGAEIPYVFDTHDDWLSRDATDDELTSRMIDLWANFARYGDPNGAQGGVWPSFDPAHPYVMELGERIGPLPAEDFEFCQRWAAELYPGWQASSPRTR